ncbi:HAD family hydrolase [Oceanidesulfovibrio marinus]|uniref:phosphoglycolate phosphatase n=1 Tax=Oceanidesulfovibrio marinus TaxID=370038 RepID=A0A6P1ZIB3_9BACT|nr:HAD-IA family hydrolase [Oceanidesulfovibrio marinus]QJT07886.1 HAD family hydrolase [Oceanidesulfovibrio marinus]TVM33386.1 HAD family hydrolase [Oceanidesulfovibrio marinus]
MHLTLRNRPGHGNTFHPPGALKGLIFDCDGVLLDTLESNRIYYNAILEKLGLGSMAPEQLAYVHSHTAKESLEHIVPEDMRHRIPEALKQVVYARDILPYQKPMPLLREAMDFCKAAGLKMAVATNRFNTMDRVVQMFNLEQYFSHVMTARNTRAKPNPDPITHILHQWNVKPQEVAFVGDTDVDQLTARRAGVLFWAFGDESLLADAHIRDYRHFMDQLSRVLPACGCRYGK